MSNFFNYIEFGEEIRNIRLSRGFTQKKVFDITGINVETLRRIEKGSTIPRYSTLDLLSQCYRKNLFELLKLYSSNQAHNEIIRILDEQIISGNYKTLNDLSMQYLQQTENDTNLSFENKLLKIFVEGTKHYKKEDSNYENVISKIIKLMSELHGDDFNISNLNEYIFFPMEIRILFVIANFYRDLNQQKNVINIFEFCLNYLLKEDLKNIEYQKLIINTYYGLSYSYHLLGKDEDVIKISNECIKFIISNDLIFHLDSVYFRKGIAEYYLDLDYHPSLLKSVTINRINSDFRPTCNFEEILLKQYGISIDI